MRGTTIMRLVTLLMCVTASEHPTQAASLPAVESERFMVVSAHHLASDIGAEILRHGGNAIDAAVAVGYALAVVDPCCGNIGGGGFMTIHLADGTNRFINFREAAPLTATARMYLDAAGEVIPGASRHGARAVGVPGTVAGLELARVSFGTMARETLLAPAIHLAQEGFVLTRADTDIFTDFTALLRRDRNAARVFLDERGAALQPGTRLVQADLAATLADIARDGPDAFYRGRVPKAVAALAARDNGLLTEADFAAYRATLIEPLRCMYRGAEIISAPPPSSGGTTLCEILNILENFDLHSLGWHSAASVHAMVEAMRQAFFDRNTTLGDPDFVTNPLGRLLSKAYAAQIAAGFTDRASPSSGLVPPPEPPQTTHYSVMDGQGNAVAVTYTVNGGFGAGVMADGTGFILNNEMDDFAIKPGTANMFGLVQGAANAVAPGKRPLSSMAPTIVLVGGRVAMVTGSPGGSRIISIVLETILNTIDFGMAPQEAVDAPRLHHQWLPDMIYAEPRALSADTQAILRHQGYAITEQAPWGAAEVIAIGPERPAPNQGPAVADAARSGRMLPGWRYGANDSRRPAGAARGD